METKEIEILELKQLIKDLLKLVGGKFKTQKEVTEILGRGRTIE